MRKLNALAAVLTIVGGLNWGLVGLFRFDLVAAIFGCWAAGAIAVPLARGPKIRRIPMPGSGGRARSAPRGR
jgi:acyl-CoA synthetase (AMP-forming)/AMP-acid ligase II